MISRRDISSAPKVEGRTLSGVAAVYGQQSRTITEHGRTFVERIAPGAFGDLTNADVKLYYNHDMRMPLARTKSGSLELNDGADGLRYSTVLPDTTLGNDVRTLLERGDLTGEMSFGFYVAKDEWNAARTERTVQQATLVEISVVQDAAYPQTSSALRSAATIATRMRTLRLREITQRNT
jgi:HK97 family phage prohead protease